MHIHSNITRFSEGHLQRKLNLPGLRCQRRDVSCASNAVPTTLKQRISRNRKIGVVEDIKNLCPELHTHRFAWFEDLLQRKIDISKPGPREGVSSQVAIGP